MEPQYDIFRTEPDGAVCWLEAVSDFATAKEHIKISASKSSRTFLVMNQRTHGKIRVEVKPDGHLTTRPA